MKNLFVLNHNHMLPDGVIDTKLIGTYETKQDAYAAIERIKIQPGFCDTINGFYIEHYELGKTYWENGFSTDSNIN